MTDMQQELANEFRLILTTEYRCCSKTTALFLAKDMGLLTPDGLTVVNVCDIWRQAVED